MEIQTTFDIGDLVENDKKTAIGFVSRIEVCITKDNSVKETYWYGDGCYSEEETMPYDVDEYHKEIENIKKELKSISRELRRSNGKDDKLLERYSVLDERLGYLLG